MGFVRCQRHGGMPLYHSCKHIEARVLARERLTGVFHDVPWTIDGHPFITALMCGDCIHEHSIDPAGWEIPEEENRLVSEIGGACVKCMYEALPPDWPRDP
jgi:hypothetical protein